MDMFRWRPRHHPETHFRPLVVSEGSSAERQHTSARAHPVPEAVQLPPLCYFYAKIACQHLRQECSACARCQLNLGAGVVVGYSLGTSVQAVTEKNEETLTNQ